MSKAIDFISSCGGSGFDWNIKTHDFTIEKDNGYFIDTSSGSIIATLPSDVSIGDGFYLVDSTGSLSDAEKLVIDNNGHNIMGLNDVMEVTEKYMSLYMVYADTAKGWVIADGKGCDEDVAGGEITIDTTIYLAPSASSQTPLSVVGSDETGDGSSGAPFFSIKRAMEYLENYRIKVGTYVTIRGLSGHYYYNGDHSTNVKHKDAKYIKVQFDGMISGNFSSTTITTDTVSVTSEDDYDLISFRVAAIGSGFYEIKAGDYIKIMPAQSLMGSDINASVWAGFYRVASVNSNEVTIIFKRNQVSGQYATSHNYLLPSTISSGQSIYVTKMSTHIYYTVDRATYPDMLYLFESDYGFGGIQMYASNEGFYNGTGYNYNNTYSGKYSDRMIRIYDGILHDVIVYANGFYHAIDFENLRCDATLDYLIFTSCYTNYINNTNLETEGFIFNNCHYGLFLMSGSAVFAKTNKKNILTNMYYDGMVCKDSAYSGSSTVLMSDHTNCFYNRYGFWFQASHFGCIGFNIQYNNYGIVMEQSRGGFFTNYDQNTPISTINNNYCGVKVSRNSFLYVDYCDFSDNNYGLSVTGYSKIQNDDQSNLATYTMTINNCVTYGINMEESSMTIAHTGLSGNSVDVVASKSSYLNINACNFGSSSGIRIYNSSVLTISGSTFNCSYHGIMSYSGSYCRVSYCGISNSTGWAGVDIREGSNAYIYNSNIHDNRVGVYSIQSSHTLITLTSSSYEIKNNTNNNLYCYLNGNIECDITPNAITNTYPAYNNNPTYTTTSAAHGSYVLEYIH
jgi:hypothetical protein